MISVAAFTIGQNAPGSRFRVRQYIADLKLHGVELSEFYPRAGGYPPVRKWTRPFWAVASLAGRLPDIARSFSYDVTLLQREMLSTFLTLEPLTKHPRVLDVDDAIWLNRDSSFARKLAHISDSVICGNSFLAEYFRRWNANITILPTAVDTKRFVPLQTRSFGNAPVIGWSGNRSGFADLKIVEASLRTVLTKYPKARLRIMADERPTLDVPAHQLEFVLWSPEVEVQTIQSMDIGIMPLRDTLWSRGKCSYKMLLYMSCGIPVVVSPVGMNAEILEMASIGESANSADDWISALEALISNAKLAASMGEQGREVTLKSFSVNVLAERLASELLRVAGHESKAMPTSN
ncbi:MAG TPA: glycosyltransferase family 4 protein [Candidatus Angelobacter sp.]|jgi:glycosyltransferase involved in cell wall biosynthesis